MPLVFKKFRNSTTGQECLIPAGRYGNFQNAIKKLVNYIRYNIPRYYVAHLTLTVAENLAEIDFKDLHRVLQFIDKRLKRAESDFKYVAVKEMQERGAIHYHILCIYSKPRVFPSSNEVSSSWKLGFVKITAPKLRLKLNSIAGYIGKYIGKGYEYETLEVRKSFTASQIKQIYKLSPSRLSEVIHKFGKDRAERFICTYRKVFEQSFRKASGFVFDDDGFLDVRGKKELVKKELVMEFQSEWEYVGIYPEPF